MPDHSHLPAALPARISVVPWRDQPVEAVGHRPDSSYIEAVWLGVLGPSTTLTWRRLARLAAVHPGGVMGTAELAQSLGLGQGLEKNAPVPRSIARMVAFGAARRNGPTIAVRLALPDVPAQQRQRLSSSARLAHQYLGQRQPGHGTAGNGPIAAEVGL
jgi:hypothetical protein